MLCTIKIQSPALSVFIIVHSIYTKISDNKETPTTGHQPPCQLRDPLKEVEHPVKPVYNS